MNPYDPIEPENERQLAWQPFCTVTLMLPDTIIKWGHKIRPLEEASMRLVEKHASSIPIPQLKHAMYKYDASDGEIFYGELFMSYIPGKTLKVAWAGFDDATKPKGSYLSRHMGHGGYSPHDSAASPFGGCNPLLGDNNDVTPAFLDEKTFRDRIYARYAAHNGLSYRHSAEYLPERLPRSDTDTGPVFTHGDLAPRNIIVDNDGRILALLD